MKNKPIAFQIWIVMTIFAIFISVLVVLTVSISINNFFKKNTFDNLRNEQINEIIKLELDDNLNTLYSQFDNALQIDDFNIIKHVLIQKKDIYNKKSNDNISQTIIDNIIKQNSNYGEYVKSYNNYKLFYIVKQITYNNEQFYFVSIYWDKKQKQMIFKLIINIVKVISTVFIINITLAKFISKEITAPIRYLEKKVSKIAQKDWDTKINLDRQDEVGNLAVSINKMKDSLKKKDIEEQTFIQTISHDLKTPVMIIRSYTQALIDKIYINNSFEDTVKVIEKETLRLELKIEQLLYLYSFDYIMNNRENSEEFNLGQVIKYIVNKISLCRSEIRISVNVEDILISGSLTDLTQAFENILENSLRYAKSNIKISSRIINFNNNGIISSKVEIEFFNDGIPIDNTVIKSLFNKFQKGKNGRFGLGLFISKKIIEFHEGQIRAENLDEGVVFKVTLPIK